MITTPRNTTVLATGTATSDFALSRFMKGEEFAMKKTLKAVIAMILVLALGFAVAAPVFAASASTVAQSASIKDFFKKIGDSIKKFFEKIFKPTPKPDPQPDVPSTDGSVEAESVPIDDSQDKGNTIGKNDVYASPLW